MSKTKGTLSCTGLCVLVSVLIPIVICLHMPTVELSLIQLLTRSTHNTHLPRVYMGIHKQQEDEAREKF